MDELTGKAALVTGGSRGIGAAIATALAERGADVAITFRSAADRARAVLAAIAAAGRRGLAIEADSADPEAVVAAVRQTAEGFGRLDILVNNAGIFPFGPPEEVSLAEIDRTLAIHVRAVFVASQAALGHMGDGGRIISIGSCFAQRVPYGGVTLYAMSKSALIGFTKGLARDVGAARDHGQHGRSRLDRHRDESRRRCHRRRRARADGGGPLRQACGHRRHGRPTSRAKVGGS